MHETPDVSGVPEQLRPIVEGALLKNPAERPTAQDLLARAAAPIITSDDGAEVKTQAALARNWLPPARDLPAPAPSRPSRPHRLIALSAATAVVIAVGAGTALLVNRSQAEPNSTGSGRTAPTHRRRPLSGLRPGGTRCGLQPGLPGARVLRGLLVPAKLRHDRAGSAKRGLSGPELVLPPQCHRQRGTIHLRDLPCGQFLPRPTGQTRMRVGGSEGLEPAREHPGLEPTRCDRLAGRDSEDRQLPARWSNSPARKPATPRAASIARY